jgi:phage terminase small subunit
MAILTNPKHELFAQGLAVGKTQEQSYIDAGYAAGDARAKSSRLMATNGNISARVAKLQERGAIKVELTLSDMIARLDKAYAKAEGLKVPQTATMVAATMGQAKLLGFIIDKGENKVTITHEEALAALDG